jgi:hypothetical protein
MFDIMWQTNTMEHKEMLEEHLYNSTFSSFPRSLSSMFCTCWVSFFFRVLSCIILIIVWVEWVCRWLWQNSTVSCRRKTDRCFCHVQEFSLHNVPVSSSTTTVRRSPHSSNLRFGSVESSKWFLLLVLLPFCTRTKIPSTKWSTLWRETILCFPERKSWTSTNVPIKVKPSFCLLKEVKGDR